MHAPIGQTHLELDDGPSVDQVLPNSIGQVSEFQQKLAQPLNNASFSKYQLA